MGKYVKIKDRRFNIIGFFDEYNAKIDNNFKNWNKKLYKKIIKLKVNKEINDELMVNFEKIGKTVTYKRIK